MIVKWSRGPIAYCSTKCDNTYVICAACAVTRTQNEQADKMQSLRQKFSSRRTIYLQHAAFKLGHRTNPNSNDC